MKCDDCGRPATLSLSIVVVHFRNQFTTTQAARLCVKCSDAIQKALGARADRMVRREQTKQIKDGA